MKLRVLLLLIPLCWHVPAAFGEEMVAIVNPSVSQTSITRNFARALFGMRAQRWPGDGGDVTVFVLPDQHVLHAAFAKNVLDMFPQQLRNAWDRLVYSGTGRAPVEVSSEEEMLEGVAATPGAVGYVSKGKVNAKRVRTLDVL
jgi:ABC-type phosphate transport system substrate-binding protein